MFVDTVYSIFQKDITPLSTEAPVPSPAEAKTPGSFPVLTPLVPAATPSDALIKAERDCLKPLAEVLSKILSSDIGNEDYANMCLAWQARVPFHLDDGLRSHLETLGDYLKEPEPTESDPSKEKETADKGKFYREKSVLWSKYLFSKTFLLARRGKFPIVIRPFNQKQKVTFFRNFEVAFRSIFNSV